LFKLVSSEVFCGANEGTRPPVSSFKRDIERTNGWSGFARRCKGKLIITCLGAVPFADFAEFQRVYVRRAQLHVNRREIDRKVRDAIVCLSVKGNNSCFRGGSR